MADEKSTNGAATAAPATTASAAKERSPNYPQYTLTDAIGLAQKIYDKEKRTPVQPVDIASALGYGSLSGPARVAIATLRQYGLLETTASGIRVSDNAMAILHQPADSNERKAALYTAARKPPLITELVGAYADASDDALRGYLVTRKAFTPEAAGRFILAFRDALKFAKADVPGYTALPEGGAGKASTPAGGKHTPAPKPGAHMEFTWPLSGDAVATMTVSRRIEADDVETLASYFEIAKKALLKAARTTAAETAAEASPNHKG